MELSGDLEVRNVALTNLTERSFTIVSGPNQSCPRPDQCAIDLYILLISANRDPKVGEAFTLLTMEAGDDIHPYHHRQIIPLTQDQWADWLNPDVLAEPVLTYLPPETLRITQVYPHPPAELLQSSLSL